MNDFNSYINHYFNHKGQVYKTYAIMVEEHAVKTVYVKASSLEQAKQKVEQAYINGDIMLTHDNVEDTYFIPAQQSQI